MGETAPASYARTLLHLHVRWVSQRAAILGSRALQAFEAAELTLHSMKWELLEKDENLICFEKLQLYLKLRFVFLLVAGT